MDIQLNLSKTAILGIREGDRCREVTVVERWPLVWVRKKMISFPRISGFPPVRDWVERK